MAAATMSPEGAQCRAWALGPEFFFFALCVGGGERGEGFPQAQFFGFLIGG